MLYIKVLKKNGKIIRSCKENKVRKTAEQDETQLKVRVLIKFQHS